MVRSKHPRKDVESGLYLYDHLKNQPELGGYQRGNDPFKDVALLED